ncbi:DUF4435 domain-containing protein [Vibrio parahaemolyticus]|uniref:DUF4435 domain-containing protein n=1 Tax=Vibrio parahaemolyticus TaxID=670 RepID=UPI00226ABDC3|nr:DUF4435 domain-containing protein [Vibrio parahaemolyticus]MCX8755555.1 DUF4435 domain-containing protein [Vibrio parahaemolyticus]
MSLAILEIDELLNEAIMTETPILLVEGVDDIPVYESIFNLVGKNAEVYAAEVIKEGSDGCRGVIGCIESLREEIPDFDIKPFLLGIMDRDARYYRGEIPQDEALLVLEAYSIESHFVTKEATRHVIKSMTRVTERLLTEEQKNNIHNKLKDSLQDLFYTSLEALKNACIEDYEAKFGYSANLHQIKNQNLNTFRVEEREALDQFAAEKGITNSWEDLLKICKGKWLMHEFCSLLREEVNSLTTKCRHSEVSQCQFCMIEAFDKCLYKVISNLNTNMIQNTITKRVENGEVDYIFNRVEEMV